MAMSNGLIIGLVVGAVILLVILIIVGVYLYRRRSQATADEDVEVVDTEEVPQSNAPVPDGPLSWPGFTRMGNFAILKAGSTSLPTGPVVNKVTLENAIRAVETNPTIKGFIYNDKGKAYRLFSTMPVQGDILYNQGEERTLGIRLD